MTNKENIKPAEHSESGSSVVSCEEFEKDYRTLSAMESVQSGDVVKNIVEGAYYEISESTIHGLLIDMSADRARQCKNVADVLRKI